MTRRTLRPLCCLTLLALGVALATPHRAAADESSGGGSAADSAQQAPGEAGPIAAGSNGGSSSDSSDKADEDSKPKYPPASKVLKDTKEIEGVVKMHLSDEKLFAELKSSDLDKDFIVLITIAKGIGQAPLLGGYSWNFDDNWVWQFRKQGDNIHIVRRNVRFKAASGTPTSEAVKLAYTDSILFSLPIASRGSGGSYIVDLSPVFLTDLPQISQVLYGFSFNKQRSSWGSVTGYDQNVEIQVAATYASSGTRYLETVPDSRAATINVHYSISRLPDTDYEPREADDRIGYFLTAVKDFSKKDPDDRFVRYITRWNLQKADKSADVSVPKKPIKFWLEKTVPYQYRKPIRDGIEEWNLAFEKAGFYNAIEVEQQPQSAEWDPGDINYNTFRWITSGAGFAMGPSRVNPMTGEILDADIIFDADFLQAWKQEYELFTPQSIAALTGGPIDIESYEAQQRSLPARLRGHQHTGRCSCNLLGGAARQMAFAATIAATRKRSTEELDKLVNQGLKEVTMHEVGHTLGLRHNFKASTLYSLDQMKDVEKTRKTGLVASVMDYAPVFILPEGEPEVDYYTTTIGPYDYWAIEYGYKPLKDEKEGLEKIASRSGEPGLAYTTDEETRGIDPDPHSRRFDFSNNLVDYANLQVELVREALPKVVDDLVEEGEGYQKARQALGVLMAREGAAVFNVARYVGGVYLSRSHKGDDNAPEPFELVDPERQREALALVSEELLGEQPFNVPRSLYNKLTPSRWSHWGVRSTSRIDYPVHQTILMWQDRVLDQLLSSLTLTRLHDNELKLDPDEDALTVAELMSTLSDAVFAEIRGFEPGEYTNRKPLISSLRRNLQRSYLERLATLALDRTTAPEDCQTLAYAELADLRKEIDELLEDDPEIDRYTSAHLREASDRIEKTLKTDRVFERAGGGGLFSTLIFGAEPGAEGQAPVLSADPEGYPSD
ncbi:zinc-dependent metalloprotease [Botrimarina sp.]|uniref:zinc-dependent metalloprotease n=1 Tax=Botrimarina sp. TaxID=2795802 RepID=UPI0032EF6BB9